MYKCAVVALLTLFTTKFKDTSGTIGQSMHKAGHQMQKENANRRGEELSGIPDVEWMKVRVLGVVAGRQCYLHG